MKKFVLTLLLVVTISANAVDKQWDFSTWDLNPGGFPAAYTVVDELMLCDPQLFATYGVVVSSIKTIDGIPYTRCFKLGGSGGVVPPTYKPVQRCLAVNVAGNSTIAVSFLTASTSALRNIIITDGTNLIGTLGESLAEGVTCTANYTGGNATIYIYSDASINIFNISVTNVTTASVTSPLATGIKDAVSSDILSKVGNELVNPTNLEVEVYTVLGAKVLTSSAASISVNGLANGVYVAKTARGTLKFIK